MAMTPLRLPLSNSTVVISDALTTRCLIAVTPRGMPRRSSFHSIHEPTTPKTPMSCSSSIASFHSPASSTAAPRRYSFMMPLAGVEDAVLSTCGERTPTAALPCLLGRTQVSDPIAIGGTVNHSKPPRRVHFDTDEKELASNARDAFLARQNRIGTRRN